MLRWAAVLLVSACTVESPGDVHTNEMTGRLCTMQMSVAGSFQQSVTPPAGTDGCWPIGTWTFQATPGESDCGAPVTPLPQYQFEVEQQFDDDGPIQVFHYVTDPSAHSRVKVSQGGDGLCEGELDLWSGDGTEVWIIKPELYADQHLGGDGEYAQYATDQWIGDE